MKRNFYDLFMNYNDELPKISEDECNTERIKQLVMKKTNINFSKTKKKSRFVITSIAAALIIITGVTAIAGASSLGLFKNILHNAGSDDYVPKTLPLVGNNQAEGIDNNISEERIIFEGDESVNISSAGMYYDNNTLMLSLELKINSDTKIPTNACIVPYVTKELNGKMERIDNASGVSQRATLIKGDEPNTYYATCYFIEPSLTNSKIQISINNINTLMDLSECQQKLVLLQEQWKEEAGGDKMSLDEWKEYWKNNNLDQKTVEANERFLNETKPLITGTWTAEIEFSKDMPKPLTAEKDGFKFTADLLSVNFECENEAPEDTYYVPVITMKDGTAVFHNGDVETLKSCMLKYKGYLSKQYDEFAASFGNIYCYKKPYPTEDIQDITVYVMRYENNEWNAEEHIIYQK